VLILTRRIGESVHIGDDIGINAPKEVPVHREEIYYRIKHEQEMRSGQVGGEAEGNDSTEDEIDDNFGNA